jgi:hypothetical protein
MLQAGRSWVRFPIRSLDFSVDLSPAEILIFSLLLCARFTYCSTLKMEAERTSETPVNYYRTACDVPENSKVPSILN